MPVDTVLIIEDEPAMRRGLTDNFEQSGYGVIEAADGETGLRAALTKKPDLILLDIMLPGVNGYEICRRVRERELQMPIVMLTAKGQESDIVLGLNLGADDYVTKPFSIRQLLARCQACLRRYRRPLEASVTFGPFELQRQSHRLLKDGREVALTPKEYALLDLLVRREGCALTRDQILQHVWGRSVFVTARSVDRCVTTLRRKFAADRRQRMYIVTVRDVGYRFESPRG